MGQPTQYTTLSTVDSQEPNLFFLVQDGEYRVQLERDAEHPNTFILTPEGQAELNKLVKRAIERHQQEIHELAKKHIDEDWHGFTKPLYL